MKAVDNRVNLISFGSEAETTSVYNALIQLGNRISPVNSQQWIGNRIANASGTSVLVLPTACLSDENLHEKILFKVSTSRYLAVFSYPITSEIQRVLEACQECCSWPCGQDELALRIQRMSPAPNTKDSEIPTSDKFDSGQWIELNLVGSSPVFRKALTFIKNCANCDAPVLIEGETGSGKEMVARATHYLSARRDYPFIPVNCGAIPDNLIENELFGHEKGAYTDAKQCQSGLIAEANDGTLFLDEIETLSIKGQVALLRFIEDQKIKPLGGKAYRKVNVRIISASNAPISELVKQGLFRQDLLFRLNLLQLRLPPLRERIPDIQCLAEYFMQKFRKQYQTPHKKLCPDTVEWMNHYQWPGNVRELENFIQRKFLLDVEPDFEEIENNQQSTERRKFIDRRVIFDLSLSFTAAKHSTITRFEQGYLAYLMERTSGNVSQAANMAQKERRALGKLLKKNNIDPAQYRAN